MPLPAYMNIADIPGSCKIEGRTNQIEVLGFNHEVYMPTDRKDGSATSTRIHKDFVLVKNFDKAPVMSYQRVGTMNNTAWQRARDAVGLSRVRVHDLRHTFGQRLRDAGVSEEDRALLLGHAIEGMPQHYATATVARLVDSANKVRHTVDRTTLLRVVNG